MYEIKNKIKWLHKNIRIFYMQQALLWFEKESVSNLKW